MSLIDSAMYRARTVLCLLAFIFLAGTIAYVTVPKESNPDIQIPIIYVSTNFTGISPEDAERFLVRPMERELRVIEGVKEMRSTAREGGGNVLLEFDVGFDVDTALNEVREKIDLARSKLPDGVDEPVIHEVNLSLFPILTVTLSGDVPQRTLLHHAKELREDIEALSEVLEANISGDREEIVELVLKPELIESYALKPEEIAARIAQSNRLVAAGTLDAGDGRFAIKVPGVFTTARDIMNIPLVLEDDSVVLLKELVEIRRTFKDATKIARINGQPAIVLEVVKRTGENIVDSVDKVRHLVTERTETWPDVIKVSFSGDNSKDIRSMLRSLQNNILSAILLVLIVIIATLGFRGGMLVGVAIPGALLSGILFLSLLGFTVNVVVLFALILSVGMLVDGAIVVTEFADRKILEGEKKRFAYALAAKRMSLPIIASTATTLAAFLPLMFWPGVTGEFMKFLPVTLTSTLIASLFMALVFIPVLGTFLPIVVRLILMLFFGLLTFSLFWFLGEAIASMTGGGIGITFALIIFIPGCYYISYLAGKFFPAESPSLALKPSSAGISSRTNGQKGNPDKSDTTPPDIPSFDKTKLKGLTRIYVAILEKLLKIPGLVILCAFSMLGIAIFLYWFAGKGVEFFPNIEPERIAVNIHARGNLSVEQKSLLVQAVEQKILEIQEEHGDFNTIYTVAGNIRGQGHVAEDSIGKISLEYLDWNLRRPTALVEAQILERTASLAGIVIEIQRKREGPSSGKPVHLELSSHQPVLLENALGKIRTFMDGMVGLKNIEDSRPVPEIEWELSVNIAQAQKFGISTQTLGRLVKMVTSGQKVSDYRPDDADDEIDVVVRFPLAMRTLQQMDHIRIVTDEGSVPAGQFVTRRAVQKTSVLRRVDGRRIMFVKADVHENVLADTKIRELKNWLDTNPFANDNIQVTFKGESENQKESEVFLLKAFGTAIFLMAIILITQFNSFYSASLILFAVIMSTTGVLLGLLVTGQPFGIIMSGIGVIALAGIIVNNNIVLIDTFDRLKEEEPTITDAILRTGGQRLRPVLLTTATTILGLLPMVLQVNLDFFTREITVGGPSTQWWVQLASAILFGLAFATVMTLIATPCALQLRYNILSYHWFPKLGFLRGGITKHPNNMDTSGN